MPTVNELKTALRLARTADNAARLAVDRQQSLASAAQTEAQTAAAVLSAAESDPAADAGQLVVLLTAKQDAEALAALLDSALVSARARWATTTAAVAAAQQALADATS